MQKATINGVRIHYCQAGRGPDLVMLHGLASDLSFWFLRILPHLTDSWRVTLYDQRGHGLSEVSPSGYTTANLARDLVGLLDHLEIERPHVVGHSFGATVALHHGVLRPDRARSLALFDCWIPSLQPLPPLEDGPFWQRRREALVARGVEVTTDTPKVFYSLLEETLARAEKSATDGEGKRDPAPRRPGARALRRWDKLRETTLATDTYENFGLEEHQIKRVVHPTLLSFGEHSRAHESCRALGKCLPNNRTVIHPGVGHFFPSTSPELAVADIRSFLGEVEREAGKNPRLPRPAPDTDEVARPSSRSTRT